MSAIHLMKDQTGVGMSSEGVQSNGWTPAGDTNETKGIRSVQAGVIGTGAVTATIKVYGANDTRFPIEIASFALSGTGSDTDITDVSMPYEFYRAEVVAITGTGAKATVAMRV